jgi:hypothetical protein
MKDKYQGSLSDHPFYQKEATLTKKIIVDQRIDDFENIYFKIERHDTVKLEELEKIKDILDHYKQSFSPLNSSIVK